MASKLVGKWSGVELYQNGKTSDEKDIYDCWFVTKDNKICMRQKASFDSEKNEWDAKETLYELSEDGKVLKNCTEGG